MTNGRIEFWDMLERLEQIAAIVKAAEEAKKENKRCRKAIRKRK